jgi:predicted O-methyltransferase YrrM
MSVVKTILKQGISLASKSATVSRIARLIVANDVRTKDTYAYLKARFVENGKNHSIAESTRQEIVGRFECIDREVPIATTPTDGLILAEMLLNTAGGGAIVECGCYAGGSSAKLSIVAKLTNRELIVCDSFVGLPGVDTYNLRDQHCRRNDQWISDWTQGRYAVRLDLVKGTVEKYGEISRCRFIKGWFKETLTDENLPEKIAFVFTDVDIPSSSFDCFIALWPRLREFGVYATHDAAYIKVLQKFYDSEIWTNQFKATPPILFGAGFGICNDSPHLGYMAKGNRLSPEYLKSLTLDK